MALDQAGIDVIRNATFSSSWSWRGYDRGEVEKFLDTLADWLESEDRSSPHRSADGEEETGEIELNVQADAIRKLEARVRELERELTNANRRERRLESKLEESGRRLRGGGAKRPATSERAQRERRPVRRRRRTTSSWAKVPRGKVDINRVSFEELRGLGVSIPDGARIIGLREIRGGFKSLDVLDEIETLSERTRRELKERFVVGPRDRSR